ncbi:TadE family type IV pilus minor pilin [Rhodococcus erythropolis]|uniref:TadE family type IV pilus minor pilin n=1 Tax=Rhodococcus erythropolis TaxID=1833 RepID=UPI003A4D30AD
MLSTRGIRQADDGAVTVEAAIALASIVTVVVLCIGGVLAVSMQVRCVDAARDAAREAACTVLAECEVQGWDVVVEIRAPVLLSGFGIGDAQAYARAGPIG